MTLREWRKLNRYSQSAFVKYLEEQTGVVVPQNTLHTWETGRVPPDDKAEAIRKATKGKVKPESFERTRRDVGQNANSIG